MISLSGIGVHSGAASTVRLTRSEGPVSFRRAGQLIPASARSIVSTNRTTVLGAGSARVAMVEHLLAALHIRGWWSGLLIEVTADELPVLDGSALAWLETLDQLGAPPPAPEPLVPGSEITVRTADSSASWAPGPDLLDVSIRFSHPLIGSQRWQGGRAEWVQLAGARTFGFMKDLQALRASGLALGADAGNCLVYTDEGTVQPVRGADEPVRHKALDALGDLFLVGRPLAGVVRVACGSHGLHARLVQEVRARTGLEKAT